MRDNQIRQTIVSKQTVLFARAIYELRQPEMEESERSSTTGGSWGSIVVIAGTVLLLAGILVPAIQKARNEARMTQSKNNLKSFALAAHNYHDTYSVLPIGGDVSPDKSAKHGWHTRLLPFLASSPLYSQINMDLPWNDPENQPHFRQAYFAELFPAEPNTTSADGYGLIHYQANPNAFHRNSSVRFDLMTTGTANNWLFGEVCGNYTPWGYPFNWRSLQLPLNDRHGYGNAIGEGVQICLADGSVTYFDNRVSEKVIQTLADAPPTAGAAATSKPSVTR